MMLMSLRLSSPGKLDGFDIGLAQRGTGVDHQRIASAQMDGQLAQAYAGDGLLRGQCGLYRVLGRAAVHRSETRRDHRSSSAGAGSLRAASSCRSFVRHSSSGATLCAGLPSLYVTVPLSVAPRSNTIGSFIVCPGCTTIILRLAENCPPGHPPWAPAAPAATACSVASGILAAGHSRSTCGRYLIELELAIKPGQGVASCDPPRTPLEDGLQGRGKLRGDFGLIRFRCRRLRDRTGACLALLGKQLDAGKARGPPPCHGTRCSP